MLSNCHRNGFRTTTLLVGLTLAALAGTGGASAQVRDQVVDEPPGTQFQTEGIREEQGRNRIPSVHSRTARRQGVRAHAYAPRHIVVVHRRTHY
jgi:hypothetical protein